MTADASGIVLAGGRSVRFGGDKLSAVIDGRALLDRAVDPLAEICREVIVVVAPGDRSRMKRLSTRLASIRVVQETEAYRGPLAGLATGLEATAFSLVLVVGGDMPMLVRGVLELLLGSLATSDARAAVLGSGDRVEPLPMALRRNAALTAARLTLATPFQHLVESLVATALLMQQRLVRLASCSMRRSLPRNLHLKP